MRAGKPAEAVGAGVRFLPRVGQHVSLQMSRQAKAFPTLVTCVGPKVGVAPPVLPEVAGGRVTAVAVGTLEGLFSGVYPLMLYQVTRLSEALVTFVAFVGSLSRVGALVVPQV